MSPEPKKARFFQGNLWFIWLLFIVLIIFLGKGLRLNPSLLPSQMIDKPFPMFSLKTLHDKQMIQNSDMLGKPCLVHVWATWCGVCLDEHQELINIRNKWNPIIYSVSYKDQPERVLKWLSDNGDPYKLHINDNMGRLALDLGVYGTPETYVLDKDGMIKFRHVGSLNSRIFEKDILPIINQLEAQAAVQKQQAG